MKRGRPRKQEREFKPFPSDLRLVPHSPKDANTMEKAEWLPKDTKCYRNFCILTDGINIHLSEQKDGESPSQHICINKKIFDKLINWYVGE